MNFLTKSIPVRDAIAPDAIVSETVSGFRSLLGYLALYTLICAVAAVVIILVVRHRKKTRARQAAQTAAERKEDKPEER